MAARRAPLALSLSTYNTSIRILRAKKPTNNPTSAIFFCYIIKSKYIKIIAKIRYNIIRTNTQKKKTTTADNGRKMLLALAGAVARGRGVRVASHHLIFLHFSTTVDFEYGDTSLVLL